MATEPASLPRWADVTPNTSAPSSGLQDTGYPDGHAPTSKIWNWLLNLIYTWIYWLAKGPWSVTFATFGRPIISAVNWADSGSAPAWIDSSGAGGGRFNLEGLRVGDRVLSITVLVYGNAAADFGFQLSRIPAAVDPVVVIETFASYEPPAAWTVHTYTLTTPYVVAARDALYVSFSSSAANLRLSNITVTYDRP